MWKFTIEHADLMKLLRSSEVIIGHLNIFGEEAKGPRWGWGLGHPYNQMTKHVSCVTASDESSGSSAGGHKWI